MRPRGAGAPASPSPHCPWRPAASRARRLSRASRVTLHRRSRATAPAPTAPSHGSKGSFARPGRRAPGSPHVRRPGRRRASDRTVHRSDPRADRPSQGSPAARRRPTWLGERGGPRQSPVIDQQPDQSCGERFGVRADLEPVVARHARRIPLPTHTDGVVDEDRVPRDDRRRHGGHLRRLACRVEEAQELAGLRVECWRPREQRKRRAGHRAEDA